MLTLWLDKMTFSYGRCRFKLGSKGLKGSMSNHWATTWGQSFLELKRRYTQLTSAYVLLWFINNSNNQSINYSRLIASIICKGTNPAKLFLLHNLKHSIWVSFSTSLGTPVGLLPTTLLTNKRQIVEFLPIYGQS